MVNASWVTGSSLTQKENHRKRKRRKKQDKGDQKDGEVLEKEEKRWQKRHEEVHKQRLSKGSADQRFTASIQQVEGNNLS